MNNKILVAIIAAGASVLVSIVSLITALFTARSSSRTAKAIETIRQKFEVNNYKRNIVENETSTAIITLKDAIEYVQSFRDQILILLMPEGNNDTKKECVDKISEICESIFSLYEKNHMVLDKNEMLIFHSMKNNLVGNRNKLINYLNNIQYISEIDFLTREKIAEIRKEIAYYQDELIAMRSLRLSQMKEIERG